MDLYIVDVPPVAKTSEVELHQGILNEEATVIWFEISLGHIRLMFGSVGQHVIPRRLLGWPGTRDCLVPCLASLKVRIDFDETGAWPASGEAASTAAKANRLARPARFFIAIGR